MPTPTPKATNQPLGPINLSIAKIGVAAPIIRVDTDDDATILRALKNGVVIYPGSTEPGSDGTTIIVGHSSSPPPWTKYSAIFSRLDQLKPGDLIKISFADGEYTYKVSATRYGSVDELLNSGLGGDLILSSCWPTGTDKGRIVVIAELLL